MMRGWSLPQVGLNGTTATRRQHVVHDVLLFTTACPMEGAVTLLSVHDPLQCGTAKVPLLA